MFIKNTFLIYRIRINFIINIFNFKKKQTPLQIFRYYKNFVSKNSDFTDLRKFKFEDWEFIISENLKRCLFLFEIKNINYEIYSKRIDQESIFNKQLDKYISKEEKVLVLSAFPFFLIEYFGEEFFSLVVS